LGTPKITDFGLAKLLHGEPEANAPGGHTQTGVVLGTPSYMAPEQATGQVRHIGPATDVYALGAILYELLTGRPPFQADSLLATLEQVRNQEPLAPRSLAPNLPRDLEAVCLKCLEKKPRQRYDSADALAEDLRRHLDGEPVRARSLNLVGWLFHTLDRSQYDLEFHTWGNLLLILAPLLALPHLFVFLLALNDLRQTHNLNVLPLVVFFLAVSGVIWRYRSLIHIPQSLAARQLGSLLIGHVAAGTVIYLIGRALADPDRVRDSLLHYPFWTAMGGLLFFTLGSTYWGRFYLMALLCFVVAVLMPLNLLYAPLVFGGTMWLAMSIAGLHLRWVGQRGVE
jgi:serine/threonine-protein kinase